MRTEGSGATRETGRWTTSRLRVLVSLTMLILAAGAADGLDRLYRPDDPPVVELLRLYRVSGIPFPTVSFPVSGSWLHAAVDDLRGRSPGALARRLAEYQESLGYAPDVLDVGVESTFRPQIYLETDDPREGIDEILHREDPLASLELSGAVDEGPLLFTRVEAIRQYDVDYPSNLTPPQDGNPIPYEFNNVYEGYLFVPLGYLTFTLGRQPIALGPSPRASIALADVPYHDALRLTLDLGPIRMHHLVSSVDNKRARTDVDLPTPTELYAFDRNQIFFNTHYFEYRFDLWRVGTGANMVVARTMNNFNLSDFFPVFSWHNAYLLPRNMSAFVDATVAVAPGLELYGQASFDDIRTTSLGIGDEPFPTIPAFTGGSRYSVLAAGAAWDFGADFGYTHYLWGNFPREDGLARAIWRLRRAAPGYALPLTSPFGPGSAFAILSADVFTPRFEARVLYEIVGRKPGANLFTTEHVESEVLAGASYLPTHRLEIAGRYRATDSIGITVRSGVLGSQGTADFYLDLGIEAIVSANRTTALR